jgi:hypothetical protein
MGGARSGHRREGSEVKDISPSLGSCGYWHLIEGAPEGPPEEVVRQLLKLVSHYDDLPVESWPIAPIIIRAMAFELTVASASHGRKLPDQLVELLAWSTKLPPALLLDPPGFFAGGWKGGRPPNNAGAKVRAGWLDREHYQRTGKWLPLLRLEKLQQEMLGEDGAPSRSTLRKWRSEIDYMDWVTFDPEADCSEVNGES